MQTTDRTIHDYGAAVRRRLPLILILCVLGAAAGVLVTKRQTVTYRATAADAINLQSVPNGIAGIQAPSLVNPDRYTATFAHIASSPEVAGLAVRLSHLRDITAQQLLNESSASPDVNANYVRFDVTTRSRARSMTLVNSLALAFLQHLKNQNVRETNALLANVGREVATMSGQVAHARATQSALLVPLSAQYTALLTQQAQVKTLRTYQSSEPLQITNPATSATRVQPTSTVGGGAGLVAGLLLGILLAFGLEGADKRVRAAEDVAEITGQTIIGRLPRRPRRSKVRGIAALQLEATSPEVDAYYLTATRLELALRDSESPVVAITSSVEGEGKSTAAGNLAATLAATGRRVTLVELDLRRPSLAKLFEVDTGPGVVEVVAGSVSMEDALRSIPLGNPPVVGTAPGLPLSGADGPAAEDGESAAQEESVAGNGDPHGCLRLLPAGELPRDAARVVAQKAIRELVEHARADSDYVIVDTPPILAASDTASILRVTDAVVLVVQLNQVKEEMLTESMRLLDVESALTAGVIIAGASLHDIYPGGYTYVPDMRGKRARARSRS